MGLKDPTDEEKQHVCTVQYAHNNPRTLLLTSRELACKEFRYLSRATQLKSCR